MTLHDKYLSLFRVENGLEEVRVHQKIDIWPK